MCSRSARARLTRTGPLDDQLALAVRNRGEHPDHQRSRRRCQLEVAELQHGQPSVAGGAGFEGLLNVDGVAAEAVEPGHHQRVGGLNPLEHS
jgi:hypothetical protein